MNISNEVTLVLTISAQLIMLGGLIYEVITMDFSIRVEEIIDIEYTIKEA